jgi:hypothetical protein
MSKSSAFSSLPESVKRTVADLVSRINKVTSDVAIAYYQVGEQVVRLQNNQAYGDVAMEAIATQIGRPAAWLRKWAAATTTWTKADFTKLAGMKMQNGAIVPAGFFAELTIIKSEKARNTLLKAAIANNWSQAELTAAMIEVSGAKSRPGSGRKAKPHVSAVVGVQKLYGACKAMGGQLGLVDDLCGLLRDMDVSTVKPKFQTRVADTLGTLYELRAKLDAVLPALESTLTDKKLVVVEKAEA